MKINDYPSYIDEKFRINFVKKAKERVYWISPRFSKDEDEIVNKIKNKLPEGCVSSYAYKSSVLNDRGYCFSLEDDQNYIDIQLLSKNKDVTYDSLLIVDSTGYYYNCERDEETQNAIFINEISDVKLKELEKTLKNKNIIQISLFNNGNILDVEELTKNISCNIDESNVKTTDETTNRVILTTDIELKMIQDRISKIIINTPGIRTKDRHIDISNAMDIIGRLDQNIANRLSLRWKIFGRNYNIENEYKKLHNELEEIKDTYTIMINPNGRFILNKDKGSFEVEIEKFKEKLKHEALNIIEQEIRNSKSILKDLVINCYKFAKSNQEELKTCTEMELEYIIDCLISSFPTVEDVIEKCDVVYEYPTIESIDILNKEFCRKLLNKIKESDRELAAILKKVIQA